MQDWKTTIVGVIGAVVAVVVPLYQSGTVSFKELAVAATLAAIGYFAGDKKKVQK